VKNDVSGLHNPEYVKQFGFCNPECDYMEDFSSMTNTFFQKQALNCIKNGWDILLGRINPWNPVLEYLFLYITMLKV
jgi:hypothetical protein